MKKQVCSSLLALTMTMGTVAPAMAAEAEVNVQSAACTCTTACTEDNRNADCAICGAEGAQLTDCAQAIEVQDYTNEESQAINAENGFEYAVNEDGEATITKYTGSDTAVTIPSELGGKPVIAIGNYAFEKNTTVTSLTIPEGVKRIGSNAFAYCSVKEVTIPKSVESIGDRAFHSCYGLETGMIYYGGTEDDWNALKDNIGSDNDPLLNAPNIIYSENASDYEYKTNDAGDGVTITKYYGEAKRVVIPSELDGKPVTAIGSNAFYQNTRITSVEIPESAKTIGEYAFAQCTRLTGVTILKGVTWIGDSAFADCTRLTEVIIPEGVTSIGNTAFYGCSSLKNVNIPETVTSIRTSVFAYCTSLTEVTIPEGVKYIGSGAFNGCISLAQVTIPEGVDTIDSDIFRGCSKLKEITIPKSITKIEMNAFNGCEALKTVYYGGSKTDWGKISIAEYGNAPLLNAPNIIYAIQESDGFEYTVTGDEATITGYTGSAKNIVIPSELDGKKVTAIADKAFEGYANMRYVYIPKSIQAIGENAFSQAFDNDSRRARFVCYEGTQDEWNAIDIKTGNGALSTEGDYEKLVRSYECGMSGDMVYQVSDDAATLVRYFDSDSKVKIPAELGGKTVTTIGDCAFSENNSLTEVTIPEDVKRIGYAAFNGCISLAKAIIPEGVTSIGGNAFSECSNLTEVTIPEGVTSINSNVFKECSSLAEVTIPKSVTRIEDHAFDDCTALETGTVYYGGLQEDWDKIRIGQDNEPLLKATIVCKEKPKICKGGKEVEISNGTHEMRIHGKSYGTFTFAWVNSKAGWSIQNADGKYLSFDNGKLVLSDTAYVWHYDAKFYTTTEEKISSGWGWWSRPSTTTKTTYWYLVGDGTDLSISKSETNADVKLYDATESTEHSFGKWTPAEERKHTRTCTICGETETGDCTYENGACTVCGALDPDNASVSVSATVTKRTSGGGGWWWWNRPTTTTWEARITATGTGVDIDKVEYSNDGKHYLTGTSFTSDTEITKFYIRVTDSKGNVTNWLYENGKVTQK